MNTLFDMVERYELVRGPIPAVRWERVYGWPHDQALRMDGTSSEVRLYYVDDEDRWHEIDGDVGSKFEWGYGGSGPHASALAIVSHVLGAESDRWSPARLHEVVPEVFVAPRDEERCVVLASAVKDRLAAEVA
jgi:hypothetical protein